MSVSKPDTDRPQYDDPPTDAWRNPNAPRNSSPKAKAVREQRRIEAAKLMVQGLTRREIAERLGVGLATAHEDCRRVIEHWRGRAAAHYDAHVSATLLKLDVLERELMPKALAGELEYVDRVIKLIRERSALLGIGRTAAIENLRGEVIGAIDVEGTERARPQTLGELLEVTDPAEAQRLALVLHLAERGNGHSNGHASGSGHGVGHEAAG